MFQHKNASELSFHEKKRMIRHNDGSLAYAWSTVKSCTADVKNVYTLTKVFVVETESRMLSWISAKPF